MQIYGRIKKGTTKCNEGFLSVFMGYTVLTEGIQIWPDQDLDQGPRWLEASPYTPEHYVQAYTR